MKNSEKINDTVSLKNMTFFGYHGQKKNERELGQQYQADLELILDTSRAAENDDLTHTVDYQKAFLIVNEIITEESFRLIETIADRISKRILDSFDIRAVTVRLRKIKPPMNGILDHVEICINREK
ncbi:MAG: dihydroneopterin aldolase [bacterium]|nr:dihydroneopterin aldolase [bacterium]